MAKAKDTGSNNTVTFRSSVTAVRAEHGKRCTLPAGTPYEVISCVETKPGSFAMSLKDPEFTHLGGADGVTKCPCTLRCQVTADQMAGKNEPRN